MEQQDPNAVRGAATSALGRNASLEDIFAALFEYQKAATKEAREDHQLKELASRLSLVTKAAKLPQQEAAIEAGMREAGEKADLAMDAATTEMVMGIVQGLIQVGAAASAGTGASGISDLQLGAVAEQSPSKSHAVALERARVSLACFRRSWGGAGSRCSSGSGCRGRPSPGRAQPAPRACYESRRAMPVSKPHRARKWVHHEAVLSLDDLGDLRIVVVADTHSRPHPAAAQRIRALSPAAILHAGDIGEHHVLDDLAKIAPVIAVRGNIDERAADLPDSVAIDVQADGRSALRLLLMHIAVYGPKVRADAARLAARHGAQVIVCGHSHVPFVGRERALTVFNPGSIGPRRFQLPIVFGTLEIAGGKLSLRHVDCVTGEGWSP